MPPDILNWLHGIETADAIDISLQPRLSRNLKRAHSPSRLSIPTPPPEMPSLKKRKTAHGMPSAAESDASADSDSNSSQDGDQDPQNPQDMTPRASRTSALAHSRASSQLSSHRTTSSSQTGGSSPRKHLAAMALSSRYVKRGNFSETARESTKNLIPSIGPALHVDFTTLAEDDVFFSAQRDTLGSTPLPEDVVYILESASECRLMDQGESGWNAEVHHPLLAMALRKRQPGHTYKKLFKFMSCSSAPLIKEYKHPSAPDKNIDFCIYIDPEHDQQPDMASHVDNLRSLLPLQSINITSDIPLLNRPLAVPIETKRTGEGGDDAALQVSTWLEAQLELLHRLVRRCQVLSSTYNDLPALSDIGFLPGLIIQGDDWNFVAATRQDNETVIWSKMSIGTTSDVAGIYQIVTFLQILREWVLNTY
ncbi:hypothetical protein NM208_g13367 [Fusarium decemcellulare]|uniref:Uncharacterized protein n=1 Tax=Fusarium decemcellulare TaxID=57161 RepID=A0ACC1RM11_9HYPO|nr:hypothetical protein NM208_g13367 [Fusarium decemcellulare]